MIAGVYGAHSEASSRPHRAGVVLSIRAVYCAYRRSGRTLEPLHGSATFSPRSSANGWEDETDDTRFVPATAA